MNAQKTRNWLAIALAACLICSIAFNFWQVKRPKLDALERRSTPVVVAHWGTEKILIYLPLYVALDGGFFEREGLDVSLRYSGNDDQVFATVASGAALFGVGDPAFTAISREKGGNGRLIASLVGALTNWGVAAKGSVPDISDPAMLNGMRVTSFPSPSTTFTVLSELKEKYRLDRMSIVSTAFGAELAALQRGAADIAVLLEPQTSLAVSQGYRLVWSLAGLYRPFLLTGVSTTDTTISTSPEVVQAFVNGLQRAVEYTRTNPEAAAVLLRRSFPSLSADVLDSATKRLVADGAVPASAVVDAAAWRKTLELRVAAGDLKSLDTATAALDNSFASRALQPGPGGLVEVKKKN